MKCRCVVLVLLAVGFGGCLFSYKSETTSSSVKPASAAKPAETKAVEKTPTQDDRIAELEARVSELSRQNSKLEMELWKVRDRYDQALKILDQHEIEVSVHPKLGLQVLWPPIAATVNAVDLEANIIILSAGKDDGVRPGCEFTIYRGDKYVGKVIVDDVEKDHCSGYSKKEMQAAPIEKGDQARTRW